jgi:hypothetical protein
MKIMLYSTFRRHVWNYKFIQFHIAVYRSISYYNQMESLLSRYVIILLNITCISHCLLFTPADSNKLENIKESFKINAKIDLLSPIFLAIIKPFWII